MFYVNARAIIERKEAGRTEIVVQTRSKPGDPRRIELPGGRLEPYESFVQALIREVKEETGLDVIEIEGQDTRIDTAGINPDFVVECIRPFCVYQTVKGPVDSVGAYFRCTAAGQLLEAGDDTEKPQWIPVDQLARDIADDPLQFSDVDRAGIVFYINHLKQTGQI
jgi:8-oxo-dGTP pyrophosphatase MutT (NUDIX family)